MREIEHNQRLWHWANTEDSKNRNTAPERIELPGEEDAFERAAETAQGVADSIAERFGLTL